MAILTIRSTTGFALACVLGAGMVLEKNGPDSTRAAAPAAEAPAATTHAAPPASERAQPAAFMPDPVADAAGEPPPGIRPLPGSSADRRPSVGTPGMSEAEAQAALAADLGRALN